MKKWKRILGWTIIAFILQQSMFLYVEKIYLSTDMNINAQKEEEDNSLDKKTDISIKKDVGDIKVSSDSRFVAYLENNKLKVLDSENNKETEFKSEVGGETGFYIWLPNQDKILVIQKINENNKCYLAPISFDAKKNEATELTDYDLNKVRILLEDKNSIIDNVVFSISTHSLYIKVKKSSNKNDLYYVNVMNQVKKVRNNTNIGNIVVPTTNANAVIEEASKITVLNSKNSLTIPNVKNAKILGVDGKDNVYFGEVLDEKIKKVYYTVLSDTNRKWNTLTIENPVDQKNIIVDYSGKVYVNNELEGSVKELTTNKTIKYKGTLLQSYSKGVISQVNNKLLKNKIEE